MVKVNFKTEHKFSLHAEDCQIHMDKFTDENDFELKPLDNETGAGCDYFTDIPLIKPSNPPKEVKTAILSTFLKRSSSEVL